MPEIRSGFITTEEGLRLYWRAVGSGPTLVCCNGVGVSTFFWKYVVERFSDHYQVVVWDYRGHGRSDRVEHPDDVSLAISSSARDLGHVLEEVGAEQAVILGHSMGCQVALERYRQAPEQVLGLVLMLGSAGRVLDTFYDSRHSLRAFHLVRRAAKRLGDRLNPICRAALLSPIAWPFTRSLQLVDPLYTSREDFVPYLNHLASIDMHLFLRMVGEAQAHSAFDLLHRVHVPALVIAAERDDFTPMWLSEKMADTIPDAALLVLADGSHAAIIEQPKVINRRLARFLDEKILPQLPPIELRPAS